MAIYFELMIIGAGLFGFSMMLPTYFMKIMTGSLILATVILAAESYGAIDCFIRVQSGEYVDRGQFWGCVSDHLETTDDQQEQDVRQ
ncbi:hypothetical protein [Sulfitobacter mediterraneus]|uniref:hypothetical protein n=1 Tax=Sulfitobacter mediterraneus TaxID=83219 RepID=UPI0021A45260|nr:hypothetical protein [Sulfitobacter mediterraneus]UWR10605.1 hypothetical protein K3753_15330 [Sulfitobacter mediterraneus]